jgi:hypothetical protein
MLRIHGATLDVDALLSHIPIVPEMSYRRGEPVSKARPEGEQNDESGAAFLVSAAGFDDFEAQKHAALVYLVGNAPTLTEIVAWPGMMHAYLDFGIYRRDVSIQCDTFPADLLKAAGDLGIDIELSQYAEEQKPLDDGNLLLDL